MWELDYEESWAPKNWCFWTVVLEKTLESPLDCKEVKPIHPKGNQSWIFIGRIDAEVLILWPPDMKNWLTGKDPDAGQDRRPLEKGTTEDEMVGWHHRLNGYEFEQAPGVGDGQGSLVCCSPWGYKESDLTEQLITHMSVELVMPSNHLILCHPFLLMASIFPNIKDFSNESALHLRWPKYWSFSISPSNEYSGLISFRIDWFVLLAVHRTLKSLLQHQNS